MNTHNRRMIVFAIGIVVVIGLFIWEIASHKDVDSLPPLAQVAQMEDEAELNSYITHFTKAELKVVWGEPNESSTMEDVWYIDDNMKLVVNYHNNNDKAVVCSIVRTETEESTDNTLAVNITTVEDDIAKNNSYCQYIKDEDGIYLVISPDMTVTSFKFVTVQVEETESGLRYSVANELYSIDELTPEKPFLVKMQFVGLLPPYGIVFEDQKNNERFYTINMKGTDVTESYPYYLSEVEFPQDAVLENKK